MSEPKFTPGPWEREPLVGRGAWVKGKDGEWTALACGNTDATAAANGDLIAAAPELYEALGAAPIVSMYSNAESFIAAFEEWRDKHKLPALRKARGEA